MEKENSDMVVCLRFARNFFNVTAYFVFRMCVLVGFIIQKIVLAICLIETGAITLVNYNEIQLLFIHLYK